MDIQVTTKYDGHLIGWEFGHCSNSTKYEDFMMYVEKCCISPGNHTLTCYADKQPDGWKQGYIEILDHRYCDNFIGFKTMNRVEIKSNKSNIIYYNIDAIFT